MSSFNLLEEVEGEERSYRLFDTSSDCFEGFDVGGLVEESVAGVPSNQLTFNPVVQVQSLDGSGQSYPLPMHDGFHNSRQFYSDSCKYLDSMVLDGEASISSLSDLCDKRTTNGGRGVGGGEEEGILGGGPVIMAAATNYLSRLLPSSNDDDDDARQNVTDNNSTQQDTDNVHQTEANANAPSQQRSTADANKAAQYVVG